MHVSRFDACARGLRRPRADANEDAGLRKNQKTPYIQVTQRGGALSLASHRCGAWEPNGLPEQAQGSRDARRIDPIYER